MLDATKQEISRAATAAEIHNGGIFRLAQNAFVAKVTSGHANFALGLQPGPQGAVHLVKHSRPIARLLLAKQPHRGIPRAVATVQ
jgi:hypothetical protein